MNDFLNAVIDIARLMVVGGTVLFIAATIHGLINHREVTQTGMYTVIGFAFAGVCVIASWNKKRRRK